MMLLAIDWSVVGIKVLQFVLSISILVILHELGHFLTARWFKCRVEKFYLFFDPWFSIFKKKIGDTVYGLGWVPLGGYVKIAGMIDESMDREQLNKPAQPWEFRSKPAWQRLIIMLGGVTVNVLVAFLIFIMIMWVWGERYIPASNLKYGVFADSLARNIGIQDGDKPLAIDGKPVERLGTLGSRIIMEQAHQLTIDRSGNKIQISIPSGFITQLNKNRGGGFTYIRIPMIVDSVLPHAGDLQNQIRKGDTLVSFNGHKVRYNTDIFNSSSGESLESLKGKEVPLTFVNAVGDTVHSSLILSEKGDFGLRFQSTEQVLGSKQIDYSFAQAIPAGIKKSVQTLTDYVKNLKLLFTSKEMKVQDSLGGIVTMASIFPSIWDWQSFWTLTAVFSILLAFMNVLPIPALDGGHALFTIVEIITGHKPSDKFMEYAQMVGMILLLGLMAYALGLDIFRLFK